MRKTIILFFAALNFSFAQKQIPKNVILLDEMMEITKSKKEANYYRIPEKTKNYPFKEITYYLSGKIYSEIFLNNQNEKTTGKSTWYFEDGTKEKEEILVDEMNMTIYNYYPTKNNNLFSKIVIVDDRETSTEVYYPNGKIREKEVEVSQNQYSKKVRTYYDQNAKKIATLTLQENDSELIIDGTSLSFDEEDNQIIEKTVFKKGVMVSSQTFSIDTKYSLLTLYDPKTGDEISVTELDENGKPIQ